MKTKAKAKAKAQPDIEAILTRISRENLLFDTLESKRCGEDFREVAVWCVRQALIDAYQAGFEAATTSK